MTLRICTKTNSTYEESNSEKEPYPCYYHDKSDKRFISKLHLERYIDQNKICKMSIPFIMKKINELD